METEKENNDKKPKRKYLALVVFVKYVNPLPPNKFIFAPKQFKKHLLTRS